MLGVSRTPDVKGEPDGRRSRRLGAEGDVDRLPGRGGDADDLARADGDGRAGADLLGQVDIGARSTFCSSTCRPGPGRCATHDGAALSADAGEVIVSTPPGYRADRRTARGAHVRERVRVPLLGHCRGTSSYFCCSELRAPGGDCSGMAERGWNRSGWAPRSLGKCRSCSMEIRTAYRRGERRLLPLPQERGERGLHRAGRAAVAQGERSRASEDRQRIVIGWRPVSGERMRRGTGWSATYAP